MKIYHSAIFLLQILLFEVKTLKISWSFIWLDQFLKQPENSRTLSQSSRVSAMAHLQQLSTWVSSFTSKHSVPHSHNLHGLLS